MTALLSRLIEERLGQEVRVYYCGDNTTTNDRGVLVEQDGVLLRLERKGNSDLLIPLTAVRIITVDAGTDPTRTLPRSVGGEPNQTNE